MTSREGKQVETKTDAKKGEERGRDASKKPLGPRRDSDLGKEPKRGGLKKSFSRDKDEAEGKGAERPKEEKLVRGLEKGRAAPSVFDEPLERVKSNDPEVTELNVNNSDCITPEILVRFAEALEFNTAVKVFALANTRADDHVAFAIAIMLKANKTITSLNLDSNHITGKGILAIFRALLQNTSLTELRFHNQRHICGGKTEMEMAKLLKENTTLLKLGYHFELAGPRMTGVCRFSGVLVQEQLCPVPW
ncbi:hypothetical protein E2I00_010387 [Balaenoptera physalus]|uniref:Leiomodin-1 n=1 Tax=Balaenoptera physalus TaxID=9770 RepID=A0A6A1QEK9_BALPH|nr:hypothetical protein E2I00_010387 [Balaenoptera physalus]